MSERPILFSGPLVRAILAGTKTETRRPLKPQPRRGLLGNGTPIVRGGSDQISDLYHVWEPRRGQCIPLTEGCRYRWEQHCPFGEPGDRLWVRETWAPDVPGCPGGIAYRADHADPKGDGPANPMRWRPSIHMPRRAARLLLDVEEVRVERLQTITEAEAEAEGFRYQYDPVAPDSARDAFAGAWDGIYGKRPGLAWSDDPWVFVVRFSRVVP